jgi:hypothetical protein
VKRKRKEAKKESKAESVAVAEQHKGQPDLTELSKGLPSGWQVSILPRYIMLCNIYFCPY